LQFGNSQTFERKACLECILPENKSLKSNVKEELARWKGTVRDAFPIQWWWLEGVHLWQKWTWRTRTKMYRTV